MTSGLLVGAGLAALVLAIMVSLKVRGRTPEADPISTDDAFARAGWRQFEE